MPMPSSLHTLPPIRPGAATPLLLLALLAACLPACRKAPEPQAVPQLPGTYEADLPGFEGAGARVALQLRPGGTYYLLIQAHNALQKLSGEYRDEAGTWTADAGGFVSLRTGEGGSWLFRTTPDGGLHLLTDRGDTARGTHPFLVRLSDRWDGGLTPPSRPFLGWYAVQDSAAFFGECPEGIPVPVAPEGAYAELRRAWEESARAPNAKALVYLEGFLQRRPGAEHGTAVQVLVPVRFVRVERPGDCPHQPTTPETP